jgi:hypothetical protein
MLYLIGLIILTIIWISFTLVLISIGDTTFMTFCIFLVIFHCFEIKNYFKTKNEEKENEQEY